MNKVKDFFSNLWYSLINGGAGGMVVIWLALCVIYGLFFSVGGFTVLPITIIAFCTLLLYVCIQLWKHRGNK